MKLRTFIAMAAIILFTACSSTRYRATDTGILIPIDAQNAFDQQYPNSLNVVWTTHDPSIVILNDWEMSGWDAIDADDYLVRFDMDNERHYAWYDQYGNWIGTAYVVNDFTTLPVYVRNTITSQYPGHTISSVNREYHKDRTAYEVVLKNADTKTVLLVDGNGTILKYKTKSL